MTLEVEKILGNVVINGLQIAELPLEEEKLKLPCVEDVYVIMRSRSALGLEGIGLVSFPRGGLLHCTVIL